MRIGSLIVISLVLVPGVAGAQEYYLDPTGRGWVEQNGNDNGTSPSNNYIVGNCGIDDCNDGEFRNWFEYDLSAIEGKVASAELVFDSGDVELLQGPMLTYTVTSYDGAQNFDTMGNGDYFGERVYTVDDDNVTRSIQLNDAAVAAINSGDFFRLSGRVTDGADFGPDLPNQAAFVNTHNGSPLTQLHVVLVPAPATAGLLVLGLVGRRRR